MPGRAGSRDARAAAERPGTASPGSSSRRPGSEEGRGLRVVEAPPGPNRGDPAVPAAQIAAAGRSPELGLAAGRSEG